ncbi:MAG: glycosyltransferase [Candidatus Electrothrix sp. AR1]|nr:glycosyltransferase [Candidatus Electrothrix sp. AR1]
MRYYLQFKYISDTDPSITVFIIMKITVITIVYNNVNDIGTTIKSVLTQLYNNIEYIIIDGGSTDGTLEVLEGLKENGVTVVSEPDNGIYDAMNKGVDQASGDYVLFMNSGDTFYSDDVISRFVAFDPHEDLVYGNAHFLIPDGRTCMQQGDMGNLFQKMPVNHQACFVKTDIQRTLGFDLTFRIAADYDFILRAYKQGCIFRSIDLVVSNHHLDGISNTDRLRASVEGLHALLNYDLKSTIDLRKTAYFGKIIVAHFFQIDNSRFLFDFVGSVVRCRSRAISRNPIEKIQYAFLMTKNFIKMYFHM